MKKNKKVLIVATVVKKHIMQFHVPTLKLLHEMGYEIHVAASNDYEYREECDIPYCDKYYNIDFSRSPFKKNNITAYKQLKNIIEKENFNLIHCHTPVGGVVARYAARKSRTRGTKVVYTAHGFHFYKGAPLKNWIIYYPIEKYMSKYTDVLITINNEDYNLAKNKFRANKVEYINGVGIDLKKINSVSINKTKKRKDLEIKYDDIVFLSVGELNYNKNHIESIKAVNNIYNKKNIKYLICGVGPNENKLRKYIEDNKLTNNVKLLGYRDDIIEIMKSSDIFLFPSKREGLPVSVMEAMACGLPVICSNIRGNKDLIDDCKGGIIVNNNKCRDYFDSIKKLTSDVELQREYGKYNKEKIKEYDYNKILDKLGMIYECRDDL